MSWYEFLKYFKYSRSLFFFVSVFFEPTDMRRAHIPFQLPAHLIKQIKFCSPNVYELQAIARALNYGNGTQQQVMHENLDCVDSENQSELIKELKEIGRFVCEHIDNVIVTLGSMGVLVMISKHRQPFEAFFNRQDGSYIDSHRAKLSMTPTTRYYRTRPIHTITNVSGAGDSFNSGLITAMINGYPETVCVAVGLEAAAIALMSPGAVANEYFDFKHSCWTRNAQFENV